MHHYLVYVSHKYGGRDYNVEKARKICCDLAEQLPEVLFIPALSVTCRRYSKRHYADDLGLLLELESRCDVVYMAKDWDRSTGCLAEYEFAKRNGIPVAESYPELLAILNSLDREELK